MQKNANQRGADRRVITSQVRLSFTFHAMTCDRSLTIQNQWTDPKIRSFRKSPTMKVLPFSLLCEIITQGCLRLESEDSLCDFIIKGIETKRAIFGPLKLVR
jgi:hypothetical protein